MTDPDCDARNFMALVLIVGIFSAAVKIILALS